MTSAEVRAVYDGSSGDATKALYASGVYAIVNRRNGKRYVGAAVDLKQRRKHHFSTLRRGRHTNRHLQAAFKIYGEEAFGFVVLEIVKTDALRSAEQRWMDALGACCPEAGYNIVPCSQHKRLAPETIRRMSEARTGKPLSDQHKNNIREALLRGRQPSIRVTLSSSEVSRRISAGLKGHTVSAATRTAISKSKRGKPLPTRSVTTADQRAEIRSLIAGGVTISAASRSTGFNRTTIRNVLTGKYLYRPQTPLEPKPESAEEIRPPRREPEGKQADLFEG